MYVDSVVYSTYGGKANNKHLTATVQLVDGNGAPVSSAGVSVRITRNGSTVLNSSGTTDGSGQVSFTVTNARSGTYVTIVTDVAASPLVWDGLTPVNSFGK